MNDAAPNSLPPAPGGSPAIAELRALTAAVMPEKRKEGKKKPAPRFSSAVQAPHEPERLPKITC